MLNAVDLTKVLVIDIETVPGVPDFQHLPVVWQGLWEEKVSKTMPETFSAAGYYRERAGILAEFGKIVCISCGFFYHESGGDLHFKIRSVSGDDEKVLLQEFVSLVNAFNDKRGLIILSGHNIKEFDVPYLCRRMIINRVGLPKCLQLYGKKPWETNLLDTLELWKFGDYKNFISLKLLAAVLGIDTPKDDIDGSMVQDVYYNERNLPRIVVYCQKDVLTVANILLHFKSLPHLPESSIHIG